LNACDGLTGFDVGSVGEKSLYANGVIEQREGEQCDAQSRDASGFARDDSLMAAIYGACTGHSIAGMTLATRSYNGAVTLATSSV
jgi:hypothetical protein